MTVTVRAVILSLLFTGIGISATPTGLLVGGKVLSSLGNFQNIPTTTPPPARRQKRTIVPTGYKTCPEGFVLVEDLFQCVPKQKNGGFVFSQTRRPHIATIRTILPISNRNTPGESRTTVVLSATESHPKPAALRSTTESLPQTTTIIPTMTTQLTETSRAFTTETNSIYEFEQEGKTREIMSVPVTSESFQGRYELLSSRKSKEITDRSTTLTTEGATWHTTPATSALTWVTEAPIPEVDQAFIKLRELRLHATTSHRNCKHPYELRLFRDGESIDDDYD